MKTLKKISFKNAEALSDAKMKRILGGMARTAECSVTCPNGYVLSHSPCLACYSFAKAYFFDCHYDNVVMTAYCSESTFK